ncbi:MAG: hypothetical protein A4E73_01050 [Syntrophaceae bacterium PtaU1.Bin231]|nr:MAG: hypothetical protein A4E73_01050 [Syntrophaceae bacterium PtaU1.Bin231]
MKGEIRRSVLAGSWYPGNAKTLRADVESYLRSVPEPKSTGREPVGLIAPHAGYMYSGQVAAHAYRQVTGHFYDAVVLIGPSHRSAFAGVSVYAHGGYETPLGVMPVDEELAADILAEGGAIQLLPQVQLSEHSLEIQVPFLQVVLEGVPFVPLMMGDQDEATCESLAAAIVRAASGRKLLLVGSSDLSHFHPYDRAVQLDGRAIKHFEKMDARGLLKDLGRGHCEACGGGPAAAVIFASKALGADRAAILNYANSGDVTGDRDSVVGYASAVFDRPASKTDSSEKPGRGKDGAGLTLKDKKTLLDIVRTTIECRLQSRPCPERPALSDVLKERRGAFVTLKKAGMLRGCIGYIQAVKPLHETVEEMAEAAAFRDPRFSPVRKNELQQMSVEISVLTPLREIHDVSEIEVGRHGIYIIRGGSSGLLLPQVAVEYGWDRETFLSETCHKAGLPTNAWRERQTRILIFSAEIFGREFWDAEDVV